MTNAYDSTRGNVTDRQRRKAWLLETYRADVDVLADDCGKAYTDWNGDLYPEPIGEGLPACRCYRCGKLLTLETLTVDRIVPGCKGGTYRRNNIRPSCADCASKTGRDLSAEIRSNRVPVVRPGVRQLATRDAQAGRGDERAVPVPGVQASGAGDLRRNGALAP